MQLIPVKPHKMIQAIGGQLRDKLLLEMLKDIPCDEVRDTSNKEQVSTVLRFVDSSCDIREEFLEF